MIGGTIEQRLDHLEKVVIRLHQFSSELDNKIDEAKKHMAQGLGAERFKRAEAMQDIENKMTKAALGNRARCAAGRPCSVF
jgi:hypothetical protein